MIEILKVTAELDLPDCWVCAGFVRNKVWNHLHDRGWEPMNDIDVVYYDTSDTDEETEKKIELQLLKSVPHAPWSVKNQARMHEVNGDEPYVSTADAISKFPETATSVAVRLNDENALQLLAPWGIKDLVNMEVRPTPHFKETPHGYTVYEKRIQEKGWNKKWPMVKVFSRGGKVND
nr:nucleotidyltransferase family protein [Rossellomorea marisflavi]